jgi:hypothetical protein
MPVPSMVREPETSDRRPDQRLGAGARALNYGTSALLTGMIIIGTSLTL